MKSKWFYNDSRKMWFHPGGQTSSNPPDCDPSDDPAEIERLKGLGVDITRKPDGVKGDCGCSGKRNVR